MPVWGPLTTSPAPRHPSLCAWPRNPESRQGVLLGLQAHVGSPPCPCHPSKSSKLELPVGPKQSYY